MLTHEQKLERLNGIGGSDMPIILGLSSYKTPYQLWLEKTGQTDIKEDSQTPWQYWGSKLEHVIRDEFSLRHNVKVEQPEAIVHPMCDFMRANVDGFIPELNAVLEIKTTASFNAKEWGEVGTDIIPLNYLVQVAHYCAVTNADCAYIAVLIGGNDYREYKYTRDLELELKIMDEAKKFWDCVVNRIEPILCNIDDIKLKYPSHIPDKAKTANHEIYEHIKALTEAKQKIKIFSDLEEKAKFNLQKYMEDAEVLLDEKGKSLASFKSTKRGRTFLLKGVN
jgi:putative phage-type endonuclease